ncbi:MAG: carbon storage regulator [Proteobacteria bacterium]|nr:carbon storage regulator [Pseudomonadota bacterium]
MLVLSRKKDEEIVLNIGGQLVRVKVVEIDGDRVKIGTVASKEIPVDRAEVHEAKRQGREGVN